MFVLSLKRGMYLYQFGQYAWTHMILMIIFMPSSFFVSQHMLRASYGSCCHRPSIITNDIMAYLAGEHLDCLNCSWEHISHCAKHQMQQDTAVFSQYLQLQCVWQGQLSVRVLSR